MRYAAAQCGLTILRYLSGHAPQLSLSVLARIVSRAGWGRAGSWAFMGVLVPPTRHLLCCAKGMACVRSPPRLVSPPAGLPTGVHQ